MSISVTIGIHPSICCKCIQMVIKKNLDMFTNW